LAMPPPPFDQRMGVTPAAQTWSPDNRFLVVAAGPFDSCASCLADGLPFSLVPTEGGPSRPLTRALLGLGKQTGQSETIAWAPDASFLVASTGHGRETYRGKHLARFDPPDGARTQLTADPSWCELSPAVSPDS